MFGTNDFEVSKNEVEAPLFLCKDVGVDFAWFAQEVELSGRSADFGTDDFEASTFPSRGGMTFACLTEESATIGSQLPKTGVDEFVCKGVRSFLWFAEKTDVSCTTFGFFDKSGTNDFGVPKNEIEASVSLSRGVAVDFALFVQEIDAL